MKRKAKADISAVRVLDTNCGIDGSLPPYSARNAASKLTVSRLWALIPTFTANEGRSLSSKIRKMNLSPDESTFPTRTAKFGTPLQHAKSESNAENTQPGVLGMNTPVEGSGNPILIARPATILNNFALWLWAGKRKSETAANFRLFGRYKKGHFLRDKTINSLVWELGIACFAKSSCHWHVLLLLKMVI
jgi:hypothetical protein